jgi:hypothetical protein
VPLLDWGQALENAGKAGEQAALSYNLQAQKDEADQARIRLAADLAEQAKVAEEGRRPLLEKNIAQAKQDVLDRARTDQVARIDAKAKELDDATQVGMINDWYSKQPEAEGKRSNLTAADITDEERAQFPVTQAQQDRNRARAGILTGDISPKDALADEAKELQRQMSAALAAQKYDLAVQLANTKGDFAMLLAGMKQSGKSAREERTDAFKLMKETDADITSVDRDITAANRIVATSLDEEEKKGAKEDLARLRGRRDQLQSFKRRIATEYDIRLPEFEPAAASTDQPYSGTNPARPKTRAEVEALPPGTPFVNPDTGAIQQRKATKAQPGATATEPAAPTTKVDPGAEMPGEEDARQRRKAAQEAADAERRAKLKQRQQAEFANAGLINSAGL